MKVGDLVTVHPARLNTYIIVERLSQLDCGKLTVWSLHDGEMSIRMTQRFMEIISSSPDLEKSKINVNMFECPASN